MTPMAEAKAAIRIMLKRGHLSEVCFSRIVDVPSGVKAVVTK